MFIRKILIVAISFLLVLSANAKDCFDKSNCCLDCGELFLQLENKNQMFLSAVKSKSDDYQAKRKELETFYEQTFRSEIASIKGCIVNRRDVKLFSQLLSTFTKTSNIAAEDLISLILSVKSDNADVYKEAYSGLSEDEKVMLEKYGVF